MEDYGERAELRRMQREQERERRRIRDRERRQSMTQEQRERHLARRRRNYQLRRQRAANNNNRICFPLDETDAAATTSHDGHGQASFIVPCSISDYRVLQTESSEQQSSHYIDGSIRKSLRLNRVKQLARSLNSPSKEISAQSQNDKVQQANNVTFPGTTYGDGFNCF
ncbi:protein SHORT ROOT IN SALT MEDIUM 1-like [Neltuma alba]|uniref:protein SHORT ROOT IN SALT MEDIUM 1-like n=1 Tax=Neltuma alba TaxID=207710 RepID=UPI0010A49FB6|nr:protein SHORT ROOT IN SALT MEDIUM 1-like [Prosopis alba]